MKKILFVLFICTSFAVNMYAQPVADFSGSPTTICAGQSVSWTNLSTGVNGNTNYDWYFPGSTSTTSNSQNPSARTYNTPGTYSVSLIVTNFNNDPDTMIKGELQKKCSSVCITGDYAKSENHTQRRRLACQIH